MAANVTPLDLLAAKGFEQVSIWSADDLGVVGIISIHSTVMGPSLGGCRVYEYSSVDQALYDVLRLSEGMTWKNALAGLPIGGGKGVIMARPEALKNRREIFLRFGEWVDSLGGRYITAEDMGTTVEDVKVMREVTPHVSGIHVDKGGGDPSPFTARGVYLGMKACAELLYGSSSLSGKSVLIQGIGAVGMHLAELLHAEGAELLVSDVSQEKLEFASRRFSALVVPAGEVYSRACDIFSPCAIGGTINQNSAPQLNCKIVAGAANNQLASDQCEEILRDRGILYAPDFAINAGGVIMCSDEVGESGFDKSRVDDRVSNIGVTVKEILEESARMNMLAGKVAIEKAQRILSSKKRDFRHK
jgi:leucine dehydrogenase